jgi:hypothetical protein
LQLRRAHKPVGCSYISGLPAQSEGAVFDIGR